MTDSEQMSLFDPRPAAGPPRAAGPRRPRPGGIGLDASTSLAAAIGTWLAHRRRDGLSENTLKNYGHDVQLLADYVGAGMAVGEITTRLLNEYLDWMRHRRGVPCSDKTYDRRITALKSFFRWLTPSAGLRANPADEVVNVSVRSPLPVILTDEEVERALAAAESLYRTEKKPDMRPLVLFTLLLRTGLRKGEVARLVVNHLELGDRTKPHLYVRYADKRHRHKERKVDLDPQWVKVYLQYAAEYQVAERVFPWSVRLLEYRLEDITVAAGLEKHISFEMLRWTSAVRDHRAGMDPEKLRRKLGLSKVQWAEVRRKIERLTAP